jgi:hypothetical protein
MTQVTTSGTVSSRNHPPATIPASASGSAAALHSKLSGSKAVSDEGGS